MAYAAFALAAAYVSAKVGLIDAPWQQGVEPLPDGAVLEPVERSTRFVFHSGAELRVAASEDLRLYYAPPVESPTAFDLPRTGLWIADTASPVYVTDRDCIASELRVNGERTTGPRFVYEPRRGVVRVESWPFEAERLVYLGRSPEADDPSTVEPVR